MTQIASSLSKDGWTILMVWRINGRPGGRLEGKTVGSPMHRWPAKRIRRQARVDNVLRRPEG